MKNLLFWKKNKNVELIDKAIETSVRVGDMESYNIFQLQKRLAALEGRIIRQDYYDSVFVKYCNSIREELKEAISEHTTKLNKGDIKMENKTVVRMPKEEGQAIAKADLAELIYVHNKLADIKEIIKQRGSTEGLNAMSRVQETFDEVIHDYKIKWRLYLK